MERTSKAVEFGSHSNQYFHVITGYEPKLAQIARFIDGPTTGYCRGDAGHLCIHESAEESKREGGQPVTVGSVFAKAKLEITTQQ